MAGIIGTKWAKSNKQTKEKLERLKLSEVWEIVTDKRFGVRFKIANLICRDYLRNYLAASHIGVDDCLNLLEDPDVSDKTKLKYTISKIRRVSKTLNEVFDF